MHYKYSTILNVTFVTLMYGVGIPMLFPIALANFIVLYVLERLLITYYYKQPPAFDEELNKNTIEALHWASLLYFFVGYWMMSNKQIFSNTLYEFDTDDPTDQETGHKVFKNIEID